MSADLGLNNEQKVYCREAIARAGTILVSSNGHAYFEVSHLAAQDKQRLERVLTILGQISGSKVWNELAHPVTGSRATLTLELNAFKTEPEKAGTVLAGLYSSGNAYSYEEPQTKHGIKFNIDQPKIEPAFLTKCFHVVRANNPAGAQEWVSGRTLCQNVLDAIAVHINVTSVLDSSEGVVPATLYSADPVKSAAVQMILKEAAHLGKGALTMHHGAAVGQPNPVHYYQITGAAVDRFEKMSRNVDLMEGFGLRRDSVVLDAFKHSAPGHVAKITPIIQRESLGEFMTNIGIRTPVTEIDGVPLFGNAAPR